MGLLLRARFDSRTSCDPFGNAHELAPVHIIFHPFGNCSFRRNSTESLPNPQLVTETFKDMLEQLRSMGSKMVSIQCAGHGQSERVSIEILPFHEKCLFLPLQARQDSHGHYLPNSAWHQRYCVI
jgi:hypothetical protein